MNHTLRYLRTVKRLSYGAELSGFDYRQVQEFHSWHCIQTDSGISPVSLSSGYQVFFPRERTASGAWKWYMYLLPLLRICGALPPLPVLIKVMMLFGDRNKPYTSFLSPQTLLCAKLKLNLVKYTWKKVPCTEISSACSCRNADTLEPLITDTDGEFKFCPL